MTGTPVTQSPLDIFSQYKFLNPSIFGYSYSAFKDRYAVMGGFGGYEVIGYNHVDELKSRMYKVAIRYEKEDCVTLPDKVYMERVYDLSSEQKKHYDSVYNEFMTNINSIEISANFMAAKLLKLSQICSGFIIDKDKKIHYIDGNKKLEALGEIIDEVYPKKIIIWCHFIGEINLVRKYLDDRKCKYSILHGDIAQEDRMKEINKFQTDPDVKFFIGQISAGGYGINLTAASYVIYFGHTYSLEQRLQSADRCHRIGQKNKVTYIDMIGDKTLERSILNILKKKKSISDVVTKKNFAVIARGGYYAA